MAEPKSETSTPRENGRESLSKCSALKKRMRESILRVAVGVSMNSEGPTVSSNLLIRFSVFVGVLFLAVGGVRKWRLGGGHDEWFPNALWHVMWPVYTLAKLVLLALLAIALYSYLRDRRETR
jgi:hypothetical protein